MRKKKIKMMIMRKKKINIMIMRRKIPKRTHVSCLVAWE